MMRVFMVILCSLWTVCAVSAQDSHHKDTDVPAAIYRLPLIERAFLCCRYFEGWHSEKSYPYVGWGHRLQEGESYSAHTMTKRQEVYSYVPAVWGGFNPAWHTCLQCRSIPAFGERKDTQKHADPKIGVGRQEYLPGVYRFL